jgi:hypothetical protein
LGLEWKVKFGKFKIIVENLPRSSQNIVLMLETATSITNVVLRLMEINQKVLTNHVDP